MCSCTYVCDVVCLCYILLFCEVYFEFCCSPVPRRDCGVYIPRCVGGAAAGSGEKMVYASVLVLHSILAKKHACTMNIIWLSLACIYL